MYLRVRDTLLIVGPLQSNFAQIDLVEVTRCTSLVSCSTEEIVVFVDRVGVFLEHVYRNFKASGRFSTNFPVVSLYFTCLLALVASTAIAATIT